jgi:hypothetical protein
VERLKGGKVGRWEGGKATGKVSDKVSDVVSDKLSDKVSSKVSGKVVGKVSEVLSKSRHSLQPVGRKILLGILAGLKVDALRC